MTKIVKPVPEMTKFVKPVTEMTKFVKPVPEMTKFTVLTIFPHYVFFLFFFF